MSARPAATWTRNGAIALAAAGVLAVGARWAWPSHGVRRHAFIPPGGWTASVPPRATTIAPPPREEDVLQALRARLAAGAPLAEIGETLAAFGHRDPAHALEVAQWVARNPGERHDFVLAVLDDWAMRDPASAWRWSVAAGTSCDRPGAPPLAAAVLAQVAAHDPGQVAALLGTLLQGGAAGPLNIAAIADHALGALLEHGEGDAAWRTLRAWSAAPGAGLLGRDAFEHVALATAKRSPAAAAEELRALPPSPGRNFALAAVAAEWAVGNPPEALAWAAQLPADCRSDVGAAAFARWEDREPVAAAEWLAGGAATQDGDRMIAHLVADPRIVRLDLPAALSLAENVGDARLRCQCLESIVRRWAETDSAAARAYVENQSKLSSEEKQSILATLTASL